MPMFMELCEEQLFLVELIGNNDNRLETLQLQILIKYI